MTFSASDATTTDADVLAVLAVLVVLVLVAVNLAQLLGVARRFAVVLCLLVVPTAHSGGDRRTGSAEGR